jgi:hypothetical protein
LIKTAQITHNFNVETNSDGSTLISGKGAGIKGLPTSVKIFMGVGLLIMFSMAAGISWTFAFVLTIGIPVLYQIKRSPQYAFTLADDKVIKKSTAYLDSNNNGYFISNTAGGTPLNKSVQYKVGFMHGHNEVILAKYLTSATAHELLDVIKARKG